MGLSSTRSACGTRWTGGSASGSGYRRSARRSGAPSARTPFDATQPRRAPIWGICLAIASTTRRPNLEIYLSRNQNIRSKAPLDEFFDPILVRDNVREGKPSPEVYLRILEETGVPADRALAVEDSLPGVESARAAGIDVVAVHDRHSDPDRAAIDALVLRTYRDFGACGGVP